jgi:transposase
VPLDHRNCVRAKIACRFTAFADPGFQCPRVAEATSLAVEIVKRQPDQVGFAIQPRRWVVERFFAWISRNRRLWQRAEATIKTG